MSADAPLTIADEAIFSDNPLQNIGSDDADGADDLSGQQSVGVQSEVAATNDADDLRHLTISAKSYLAVIADELWLRGADPPKSNSDPATSRSS